MLEKHFGSDEKPHVQAIEFTSWLVSRQDSLPLNPQVPDVSYRLRQNLVYLVYTYALFNGVHGKMLAAIQSLYSSGTISMKIGGTVGPP